MTGEPCLLDFSSRNPLAAEYATDDFDRFQAQVMQELEQGQAQWGIARYLEERSTVLSQFPQMVKEQRFYHVGLDIIVPAGFQLFAPLEGKVFAAGIDAGQGNYGGYVILQHQVQDVTFYSFYGHLDTSALPETGEAVTAGAPFAMIGERADSGGWFTHVHLQILTQRAVDQGMLLKGYMAAADLPEVPFLFPSPYPLFRY